MFVVHVKMMNTVFGTIRVGGFLMSVWDSRKEILLTNGSVSMYITYMYMYMHMILDDTSLGK